MSRKPWFVFVAVLVLLATAWWWPKAPLAQPTPAASGLAVTGSKTLTTLPATAVSAPLSAAAQAAETAPTIGQSGGNPPTKISLDLCGVGPVPIRAPLQVSERDLAQMPHHLFDQTMAEAWPRVLTLLEAGPTDRSRAAALVLRAAGLPEPTDNLPYVRQLAELGLSTRDAGALQWALAVCDRTPKLPQCQAISPSDLVALEPEDGRHWLQLGAVDRARRDEALVQATKARLIGAEPSLAATVESAAPADLLPYVRQKLLVDAIGVEAALVSRVGGFVLFTACAKAGPDNTATCSALADMLYQRGQDLRSLGWALRVGERMGWPAERVKAVRAEEARLMAQIPQIDTSQMYSCASVDQMRNWTREVAQGGERVALERRAAAASSAPAPPPR